jgi:hypothetical protein
MLDPHELRVILEKAWRQAIFEVTGRRVSEEHPPLVEVIANEGQKEEDRLRMADYAVNPALHIFRDISVKNHPTRQGFVRLTYNGKNGSGKKRSVRMPVVKFVRRYLLLPNKKLSYEGHTLRWCPRGAFRYSKFQPILDAARRLLVKEGDKLIPILNLPVAQIKTKAEIFREHYESQGAAGVEYLKTKYEILPYSK